MSTATTVAAPPKVKIPDVWVRLYNVDWETYERLRDDEDNHYVRMTYKRGILELMSPSRVHERLGHLIGRFIDAWTEELRIPIAGCRTMTVKRKDLLHGLESDNWYYVQHESLVRDRDALDFAVDPPPDLGIEIDITSDSIERLPIYAALRVSEVWRCDGEVLQVLVLNETGEYVEYERSPTFPLLTPNDILRFLDMRFELDETSLVLEFRRWIRETILPQLDNGEIDAE